MGLVLFWIFMMAISTLFALSLYNACSQNSAFREHITPVTCMSGGCFLSLMIFSLLSYSLKARHEAVMRRTLDRSQKTKQKPNRWSWGGALHTNTPNIPAGTWTHYAPPQYLNKHPKTTKLFLQSSIFLAMFKLLCLLPNMPLWQCFSCVNMLASVSILFCHVYIWTFQIVLYCYSPFSTIPSLSLSLSNSIWLWLTFSLYLLSTLCFTAFVLSLLVQVLLSRLSSIHSTLRDWSTCRVLSVSTADTEWPPNVNIIVLCLLAGWR